MREGTGRPGLLGVSRSRSFPFVYHPISLPPGACAGTTCRSAQDEGHQQRGAKASVSGALWHALHVLAHSPRVTARVCAGLTHMLVCHAADTSGKSSTEALAAAKVSRRLGGGQEGWRGGWGGSARVGHAIDDGAGRSSFRGDRNPLASSSECAHARCNAMPCALFVLSTNEYKIVRMFVCPVVEKFCAYAYDLKGCIDRAHASCRKINLEHIKRCSWTRITTAHR